MSTQTDSEMTPARAAMERLGVTDREIASATGLSALTIGRIAGCKTVRDTTLAQYLAHPGFTDEERAAIREYIAPVLVSSVTGSPKSRTSNPGSAGWAAVERLGIKAAAIVAETGLPRRSVYKALVSLGINQNLVDTVMLLVFQVSRHGTVVINTRLADEQVPEYILVKHFKAHKQAGNTALSVVEKDINAHCGFSPTRTCRNHDNPARAQLYVSVQFW